jgi:hypothetical protein
VLWEIVAGRHPWVGVPEESLPVRVAVRGQRPPMPADAPPPLAQLITECWAADPGARPSAAEVVGRLDVIAAAHASRGGP